VFCRSAEALLPGKWGIDIDDHGAAHTFDRETPKTVLVV
jgi:hypothetical protein